MRGKAYIFNRSGGSWVEEAKIVAGDTKILDDFGSAVAIEGETVIVGAPADDHLGSHSGSAYVFTRAGGAWPQVAKLFASDTEEHDWFGNSISLSGDRLVVAAIGDGGDFNLFTGSASVFTRFSGEWVEEAKIVASDGEAGDFFGRSVVLDGTTMVVSAYGDDDQDEDSGAAYVFVDEDFAPPEILDPAVTPSEGEQGTLFRLRCAAIDESGLDSVTAIIRNALGQEVARLIMDPAKADDHFRAELDSGELMPGAYSVDIEAIDGSLQRNQTLLENGVLFTVERELGIPCGDLSKLQARCKPADAEFKLQARVTLTDTSHDGELVEISFDGSPRALTVFGARAQVSVLELIAGDNTVELTAPGGCFEPRVVTCE